MNFKSKVFRAARFIAIAGLTVAGLFIFFNYMVFWFLPFITAWIIALVIQPAVKLLNGRLKMPKKLSTVIILLILFTALGFIVFLAIDRIIYELTAISKNFSLSETTGKASEIINNFFSWLEKTLGNIPFFSDNNIIEELKDIINVEINSAFSRFSADVVSQIPYYIKSIVVTIPKMLIFTLITIISTFYISLDYGNINRFISIQIPKKVRDVVLDIKSRFLEAIYKYLKAYSIIFLITYSELTVGFLIIGIKYAFIVAFVVGLVDILPVFGSGTVLIPWGIICIVQRDYFTGFALLILYAVIIVIRNIIEPKIIGASIGLYPVVTLIAIYVGYNVLGIAGIFLFPITILILKNLNDEGKIHVWKNVKKDTSGEKF